MRARQIQYAFLATVAILVAVILIAPSTDAASSQDEAAEAIAKAAGYVYFSSFEQDPVTYAFTERELEVLSGYTHLLDDMIRDALGVRHSVGGAMLMAHFGLTANIDYLRYHILEPGRFYGWEGSYDQNDEEVYFSDHQYVYHSKYVAAYEKLADAPLHESLQLTSRESEKIRELADDPKQDHYHWANWIGRKLGIF